MPNTAIGVVVVNDGRQHVIEQNGVENMRVARQWADIMRQGARNVDGTKPEIVVGSETVKSVRVGRKVGEETRRAGVRQIHMAYPVRVFPYLAWPFVNTLGWDLPILSLSNNNGAYPGNVGTLATDLSLRDRSHYSDRAGRSRKESGQANLGAAA